MSEWDDRNQKIIEEFRANEGRAGGYFEGAHMILIHHIGAKSGTVRVAPLVYFPQDDGSLVIIASKGGAPTNPDWYHNLKANPKFDVEVGTETFINIAPAHVHPHGPGSGSRPDRNDTRTAQTQTV